MNMRIYFQRIGIDGSVVPDLQHLRLLQSHHMLHVPFENLDVYHGIPVEYSVESFYRKIVTRRRGGYCYELNGLFHWLLSSLGYDAILISGLVAEKDGYLTEFEHMAIIVELQGQEYLVDVGFGDSSLTPLMLIPGKVQTDGTHKYRIIDDAVVDGKTHLALEKWNPALQKFLTKYYFTLQRRTLDYFEIMHQYQEVVPSAYYKSRLICSLPVHDGRTSVIDDRLIETRDGMKRIRAISSSEELLVIFRDFFGLEMSLQEVSRIGQGIPVQVEINRPGRLGRETGLTQRRLPMPWASSGSR